MEKLFELIINVITIFIKVFIASIEHILDVIKNLIG